MGGAIADKEQDAEGKGDDEEDHEDDEEQDLLPLLGPYWHQRGPFAAEHVYRGEVFNNTRGGIRTRDATRYRGNFDLTLHFHTEKAGWWQGGELCVYVHHSHGTTLSPHFVGDGQYYSNIDTGTKPQDLTQLGEYYFQQKWGNDELVLRVGRVDANTDFAFPDLARDFLNSSFTTLPNIPMSFWPFQSAGVTALYQPNPRVRLGGGVYEQPENIGQWWVTTTDEDLLALGQLDFKPRGDVEGAPLTLIRLGLWYTNSDTVALDQSTVYGSNYGLYVTVDQMLLPEADDVEQGLGAFFQASWAPSDRNQVDLHYGAGLVYKGLIDGRDKDTLGCGFTLIQFSSILRANNGPDYENAVEAFYKCRVRPGLYVIPDVQYIAHPNGVQRDALVVGVRFEMKL